MLDLSPIANTIRSLQALPPQAMPSIAEETKPVPGSETRLAVPPLPTQGGGAGLGGRLDLYDTQAKPARPEDEKEKAEEIEENQDEAERPHLLGKGTGLPQPTTAPPRQELPFLKPLGHFIGQELDQRI